MGEGVEVRKVAMEKEDVVQIDNKMLKRSKGKVGR